MVKNKLKGLRYVEWATGILVLSVVSLLVVASNFHKAPNIHNSVGINEQVNYQGRLLTNTGAVVPDGTYNMEFKVYEDGDGVLGGGDETLKWTESRTSGNKVTVKNGYFSVYLGSVTAFGGNIDWNQDTLWLSINIGGTGSPSWDGEMSPFSRFSSSPYALNSKALNGLASGDFVQLAQGTQTDSSSTNASISINKTAGTANLLELLRGGANVLTIANGGATTFQNQTNSTTAFQVQNVAGDQLLRIDTATTENLITNGQFETNTTGWAAHGSAGSPSQSTTEHYLGNGSMQFTTTAAANDGVKYNYALASQTTYTMTFYVKNGTNTAAVSTISLGRSEDGSTDSDCATLQTISGAGWTKLTCTFTTATVSGTDYIYLKQSDANARTIYVDSAELQTSSNLVINPDFETDISNWNSYGGPTTSHNTSESYTGSGSMQVDTNGFGASEGPSLTSFTGTITANTTYTASFWVKTDAATSGAKTFSILKRFDSTDAGAGTSCGNKSVPVATWTNVTCTFTTGNTIPSGSFISLNVTDDGITPITFYVDTVNLAMTKYNSNDIGRISLNAAINSPLTVRGAQDSTSALQVQQLSGRTVLNVDTLNGFVGIGTDTATKTLQVDGKAIIRATTSDTDTFQVTNPGAVGSANSVVFNVAGTSRSVSVGLGSNTVNSSLNVYGTGLINTKANSASAFRIQDSSGITALSFATTNGNRRLTIGGTGANNDGKLTIASANGDAILEVDSSGTGYASIFADDFQVNGFTSGTPLIAGDGVNGFVGIGGFGAGYTLDVFGDANVQAGSVYRIGGTSGATTTCSGGQFLQDATVAGGIVTGGTCAAGGGSGVTTVGTFSGSSIANGASISGSTITFGPADATNPGMVTTGTQTFAGAKTFTGLTTIKPAVNGTALEVRNSSNDHVFSVDTSTGNAFATLGGTGLDSALTIVDNAGNAALSVSSFGGSNTLGFSGDVAAFYDISGNNMLTMDGTSNAISFGGTGADSTFTVSDTAGVSRLAIDTATGGNIAMQTDVFNLMDGTGGAFLLTANGGNGRVAIGSDAQSALYKLEVAGDVNVQSGSTYRINGADINTAGTLTNVAYENQSNTFTSSNTFNNAIAANGGITFNNASDTLGAFTNAGTQDAANNLIVNIGNAGTDFTSGGGLTLAGNLLANGNSTFGDAATDGITFTGEILGATPLTFEGATNNNIYTIFSITDPTSSNKTITFADATGTVLLHSMISSDATVDSAGVLTIANNAIGAAEVTDGTLTTSDLSASAGILNAQLANSGLTVTAGNGLITGGAVSLGGTVTLDIGAGNGITVNANDIAVDLTVATDALSVTTSSGSGLEVLASGVTLLQGCADNQVLRWGESSDVWSCSTTDLDMAYDIDSDKELLVDSSTGLIFDLTTTGDFVIQDSNTTFATFSNTGGITFAPQGTSDIVFTLDDDSNLIINDGITNTGSIFDINTTLGDDTDADIVSALNIDVTSASTGDADVLSAINIGNLASAGSTVREEAITIGTGWDYDLGLNDTTPTVHLGATDGTAVFNITDSCSSSCVNGGTTPNSLFELRDIGTNFGGLISSGGFLGTNSYMSQEFAADIAAASTADSAAVGDNGTWYADLSTAASTENWSQTDQVGGFVRMTNGATSGRGILLGFGAAQNNLSLGFAKANLPVLQMKVRTSVNNTTNDLFWGFMDQATAPTANDTKPANGIYFWNNNAAGGWQGVVRSGGADVGTVNCSGAVSATQFAVGRIQVESATVVRFLIDNDASDGVAMADCGTVSGANPAASLGVAAYTVHTEITGRTFDVDYVRVWQDDAGDATEIASENENENNTPEEQSSITEEQSSSQDFTVENINAQTITIDQALFVNGDTTLAGALTVQSGATFNGEAIFNKLATFVDKVLFQKDVKFAGRTSFNNDTGGYAKIAAGQTQVKVTFDEPYTQPPVVTLTVKNGQFVQYAYTDLTPEGFTIILSQPATADVEFSWTALQIDGAKVASN